MDDMLSRGASVRTWTSFRPRPPGLTEIGRPLRARVRLTRPFLWKEILIDATELKENILVHAVQENQNEFYSLIMTILIHEVFNNHCKPFDIFLLVIHFQKGPFFKRGK